VVERKANEAMIAPMVGSGGVCVWRESGVRQSVLRCVWQEFGFSHRKDVFIFNTLYKNIINCARSMRFAKIMLQ
jgi:hypothetical protein